MMMLLKLFLLCLVFLSCNGDISRPQTRFLSRREIAEISKIAEKEFAKKFVKTVEKNEEEPIYVEPTPPDITSTPSVENEIETIRQNISESEGVECNITAGYLWELCRPVLLRTCKEKYRTQCSRSNPRRFFDFSRRLNRMFPVYRPPEISFKPEPLNDWFEKQIMKITGAIANSTDFQFSISITNNGDTRTYTSEDAAGDFTNITRNFHKTLSNFRKKYSNLLPKLFSSKHIQESEETLQKIMNIIEDIQDDTEMEEKSDSRTANPSLPYPKRAKRSNFGRNRHGTKSFHIPRAHMKNYRERLHFLPHRMNGRNSFPWQRNQQVPPHHRFPWMRRPSVPHIPIPTMRAWSPPYRFNRWNFPTRKPFISGIDINCQKMQENPETCLEIDERKIKCENELDQVCPEYMKTRRRIAEKLDDVYTRQSQISQVATGAGEEKVNERYEWATKFKGAKNPIVIESIKVTQSGSGDAIVRARLFNTVDVQLRVPGKNFDSSESLGEAISRVALESIETQRGDEP